MLTTAWEQVLTEAIANKTALEFRGDNLRLLSLHVPEAILSGPSETGKTFAALTLVDHLARQYPGATGAIVRKVKSDMDATVLRLYRQLFADRAGDIETYGGESPKFFQYANGSQIFIGGMDRPGRVLSGSLDFCYVNQAEELMLADWETLSTRTTGRAGVIVPGILFGDCNPGSPTHWIKHRDRLMLLESRHENNPALFTDDGAITEQGKRTLATLDNLTGVRKLRLRNGLWAQVEGVVYDEFDPVIHVIDEMPQGWKQWRKIVRAIDFGYTNPFVCQWWALDGDDRMYLYREIYKTRTLVEDHARQIVRLSTDELVRSTFADHDAEDRATLERHGVNTAAADRSISVGIEAVKTRLKTAGDGKPRVFFLRSALVERDEELAEKRLPTSTLQEFEMYAWPKGADGKTLKEVPADAFNHGMDAMRYAVRSLESYPVPASGTNTEARQIHAPRPRSGWQRG